MTNNGGCTVTTQRSAPTSTRTWSIILETTGTDRDSGEMFWLWSRRWRSIISGLTMHSKHTDPVNNFPQVTIVRSSVYTMFRDEVMCSSKHVKHNWTKRNSRVLTRHGCNLLIGTYQLLVLQNQHRGGSRTPEWPATNMERQFNAQFWYSEVTSKWRQQSY